MRASVSAHPQNARAQNRCVKREHAKNTRAQKMRALFCACFTPRFSRIFFMRAFHACFVARAFWRALSWTRFLACSVLSAINNACDAAWEWKLWVTGSTSQACGTCKAVKQVALLYFFLISGRAGHYTFFAIALFLLLLQSACARREILGTFYVFVVTRSAENQEYFVIFSA